MRTSTSLLSSGWQGYLAGALESFPAAKLGETCRDTVHNIDTTWANFAIDLFYWNTVYHEGQVNYIQVLYGDLS